MKISGIAKTILAAACILFVSGNATALEWKGGVDLLFGKKDLDSDWKPVDSWQEFGVMLNFTEADLPFGITAGYLTGDDDDFTAYGTSSHRLEGKTEEFLLGARKDFAPFPGSDIFRAYINGGYAGIKWSRTSTFASTDGVSSNEVDDWGHGFWFGGGLYVVFVENMTIGIDYKYSNASSDINTGTGNKTLEVGGSHCSAFVGLKF